MQYSIREVEKHAALKDKHITELYRQEEAMMYAKILFHSKTRTNILWLSKGFHKNSGHGSSEVEPLKSEQF